MLMLQQKVRILAEPYLGEGHFDDDRIGQVTNIMSLIIRDDEIGRASCRERVLLLV